MPKHVALKIEHVEALSVGNTFPVLIGYNRNLKRLFTPARHGRAVFQRAKHLGQPDMFVIVNTLAGKQQRRVPLKSLPDLRKQVILAHVP